MKIAPNSRLVMIGDSVTDCDRARPVGEGPRGGLGHGYVADVDARLKAVHPTHRIRVTNMGISGNTVRDLAARWKADVLALKPDWLSVMIGINDVWRYFDGRHSEAVPPAEFESTYESLLTRVRPQLQGLVLMTPFLIEPLRTDPMRQRMDSYGALVRNLAARHAAVLVDTQAAFDRVLGQEVPAAFSADRVHPTPRGHMILASAFLEGIGLKWVASDREGAQFVMGSRRWPAGRGSAASAGPTKRAILP